MFFSKKPKKKQTPPIFLYQLSLTFVNRFRLNLMTFFNYQHSYKFIFTLNFILVSKFNLFLK